MLPECSKNVFNIKAYIYLSVCHSKIDPHTLAIQDHRGRVEFMIHLMHLSSIQRNDHDMFRGLTCSQLVCCRPSCWHALDSAATCPPTAGDVRGACTRRQRTRMRACRPKREQLKEGKSAASGERERECSTALSGNTESGHRERRQQQRTGGG